LFTRKSTDSSSPWLIQAEHISPILEKLLEGLCSLLSTGTNNAFAAKAFYRTVYLSKSLFTQYAGECSKFIKIGLKGAINDSTNA
jgi:hypothetical protein